MVQSGPCRGERYCAEVAPVESPFPGIDIPWVDDHPAQGSVQGPGTFQSQRLIDRIGARGAEGVALGLSAQPRISGPFAAVAAAIEQQGSGKPTWGLHHHVVSAPVVSANGRRPIG